MFDLVAEVEKKTKTKTKRQDKEQYIVEHVTNLSPFDKSMIEKSENLNGK